MSSLKQSLELLVDVAKRRYLLQFLSRSLPWVMLLSALVFIGTFSISISLLTFVISLIGLWALSLRTQSYQQLTLQNLLKHLNREHEELEESAELVVRSSDELNVLQQLQLTRIAPILDKLVQQKGKTLLPEYSNRNSLIASVLVLILLVLVWQSHVKQWIDWASLASSTHFNNVSTDHEREGESSQVLPTITSVSVLIEPPSYTGKKAFETEELDIELLAGSKVRWRFSFSDPNLNYQLQFANGSIYELTRVEAGQFTTELVVDQIGLYSISSSYGRLEGVYSITALQDKPPSIRFITPKRTITEIAKDGETIVELEAILNDDFGLSDVDILASIAKGSGEAVKFRDQVFRFDSSQTDQTNTQYFKTWHLTELGMEPGDELYFSIRARDNKEPESQLSKSQTKIVRWLEDEQEAILSGSIVIDFVPEYFKSQRQIIIETQELIANKEQFEEGEFKRTSQLLGQAQSDLKQKYGQFLGDEFGEGGADVGGVPEEIGHHDEDHEEDHDEEHEDEAHDSEEEHAEAFEFGEHGGHEHEQELSQESANDISGYSAVIEQYGHAHGQVDIGIITEQNPKAMMKRAISAMWQAELHLLLSEPEQALPFENEALHFLNKAKKAERIYVKRLGFEPPPVTEERRYQGKLDDIEDRQQTIVAVEAEGDSEKMIQLLSIIDEHNSYDAHILSKDDLALLNNVKSVLLDKVNLDPTLISVVSVLENAAQAGTFKLDDCNNCLEKLKSTLWQFIPDNRAVPKVTSKNIENTEISDSYLRLIKELDDRAGSHND
ncbi:hypothetical protein EYS14_03730 [Alteromonadaceae bacterium M269]|nr:hypothetical protein EYS14_03730 [Alteromonadaceae bacterium M269]